MHVSPSVTAAFRSFVRRERYVSNKGDVNGEIIVAGLRVYVKSAIQGQMERSGNISSR